MLEQERQKSQTLTLEQQKTRQAAAQSKNIPDHLLRSSQEASDEEGKTANNEIEDIDQLLREKEALEEESKRLDEEKKQLVFRAKMRLEREIQDMKKMNSEKQQDINQLKKRLSNLEAQDQ